MKQFILIKHIQVQDANTIAGFTWGFPAITHFLGYVHALERKLNNTQAFNQIGFRGCAVIAHNHYVKTYKDGSFIRFTQSRNPPYLNSHKKAETVPVIEEGKMNMTVSLLIELDATTHNTDALCNWLEKPTQMQRLAGGTILSIERIDCYSLDADNPTVLKKLKRELLPGFVLLNRSDLLAEQFASLTSEQYELFDAWKDFIALKYKARPQYDEIESHLKKMAKDNDTYKELYDIWQNHLNFPYSTDKIPQKVTDYFSEPKSEKSTKKLLKQWQDYCQPTDKTPASWEYQAKPNKGYLVPIMCGYKAISDVYKNEQVANTRDDKTDVCFVEAVHSVGEWRSVHRWNDIQAISDSVWQYHYTEHWYLCCHQYQITHQPSEILESPSTIQNLSDW